MLRLTPRFFFVLFALLPVAAQANFIITFGPTLSMPVGTDGLLDVYLRSDSPLGEPLQSLEVTYQISGPGVSFHTDGSGNPDELQFTDPNYVFAGNTSLNGGTVSNTQDGYSQLDFTADLSDVTVPATDVLLAKLHLTAVTAGSYSITIDSTNTVFYPADPFTPAITYTVANEGTVVVTGSTAVPEPSSFSLSGIGIFALVVASIRKSFWIRLRTG